MIPTCMFRIVYLRQTFSIKAHQLCQPILLIRQQDMHGNPALESNFMKKIFCLSLLTELMKSPGKSMKLC